MSESNATLERAELRAFLQGLGNKFFSVTYIKRKTGEVATMTATNAYGKYLQGGKPAYDAEAKGLYVLLSTKATAIGKAKVEAGETDKVQGIRSVGLEGVITVKCDGTLYTVV
jgi:hypothetical protein